MRKILTFLVIVLLSSGCLNKEIIKENPPPIEPHPPVTWNPPPVDPDNSPTETWEPSPVNPDNPYQALLIANQEYDSRNPLKNPTNDVYGVAKQLETKMGYSVDIQLNLDKASMEAAINKFSRRLLALQNEAENVVGFFYFAGHGVNWDKKSYLLPTDDRIERENLEKRAILAKSVVEEMARVNNGLNVAFFDACRKYERGELSNLTFGNFEIQKSESTSSETGTTPGGIFIAFATSNGQPAKDAGCDKQDYGLFACHFVDVLKTDEASQKTIGELFGDVKKRVKEKSGGTQIPDSQSLITTSCDLKGCVPPDEFFK